MSILIPFTYEHNIIAQAEQNNDSAENFGGINNLLKKPVISVFCP
jgi:hypothetical protein